jgi:lipoprotein-releasing system ATP-binding protein
LLGGLDDPDYGSISVCEKNWSKLSISERAIWRNQHVGFVYQFHHLLEEFSALENVALPLLIAGQSMISAKETSGKFLTSIGLEGRLDHRPSQLSGGERQRVAVIRGLINKPSVLLLDEPTGNLDSDSAKKTLDLILQLSKTLSMAIVLVTHDTFVAKNMDVTYRLTDGCLEEK